MLLAWGLPCLVSWTVTSHGEDYMERPCAGGSMNPRHAER